MLMSVTVRLNDVIDALESASEEVSSYLDKRTGEIIQFSSEEIQAAEDDALISEYPDWQRDLILKAREVLGAAEEFIDLPGKFDINEYQIMEDFCLTLHDQRAGKELLRLIKGSGAFRRFKNAIHEMGVEKAWYEFRSDALEKIAIEWLEENQISYSRNDDAIHLPEATA
jgi:Uncharacterised protein family (UPF0158)